MGDQMPPTGFNIAPKHSRSDPAYVDYGLWPFDGRDYDIVCTVTNNIVNAELYLWMLLFSVCLQYRVRCCNCGSTEHSLRGCPAPFKNTFSLLNPEFVTHDLDGSVLETSKLRIRRWCQRGPPRGAKVMTDVTALVMAVHGTLTTEDASLHTKVITQR